MIRENLETEQMNSNNHEGVIFIRGVGFRHEFCFVAAMDNANVKRRAAYIAEHRLAEDKQRIDAPVGRKYLFS
jgi:hypothetical protein